MKLHLKLKQGLSKPKRDSVFAIAKSAGAREVRPLFPETSDEELASMFTIDGVDETAAEKLIERLNRVDSVDFVEHEVTRKSKD